MAENSPFVAFADVADEKGAFRCKLRDVQVHYETESPSATYVKFEWDSVSSSELTFSTETIKTAAPHHIFVFEKEWLYHVKPRTLPAHFLSIELYGKTETKKKRHLVGAARIDLGGIASGPKHLVLSLLDQRTAAEVAQVDFICEMLQLTEPTISLQFDCAMDVRSGDTFQSIYAIADVYRKKYHPTVKDADNTKPIASSKSKTLKELKKRETKPAPDLNFEIPALSLPSLTFLELQGCWLRIHFEAKKSKDSGHPLLHAEAVLPFSCLVPSLSGSTRRYFHAYLKTLTYKFTRVRSGTMELSIVEGKLPKVCQLDGGLYNSRTGIDQSYRVPYAVSPTLFYAHGVCPDQPDLFSSLNPNSPQIGDLSHNTPAPAPLRTFSNPPSPRNRSNISSQNTWGSSVSHGTSESSKHVQFIATQADKSAASGELIKSESELSSKSSKHSTLSGSATASPQVPKNELSASSRSAQPIAIVCSLCKGLFDAKEVGLSHRDKTFCKACTKKLLDKKAEMESERASVSSSISRNGNKSKAAKRLSTRSAGGETRPPTLASKSIGKPMHFSVHEKRTHKRGISAPIKVDRKRVDVNNRDSSLERSLQYVDNVLADFERSYSSTGEDDDNDVIVVARAQPSDTSKSRFQQTASSSNHTRATSSSDVSNSRVAARASRQLDSASHSGVPRRLSVIDDNDVFDEINKLQDDLELPLPLNPVVSSLAVPQKSQASSATPSNSSSLSASHMSNPAAPKPTINVDEDLYSSITAPIPASRLATMPPHLLGVNVETEDGGRKLEFVPPLARHAEPRLAVAKVKAPTLEEPEEDSDEEIEALLRSVSKK